MITPPTDQQITFYTVEAPGSFGRDRALVGVTKDSEGVEVGLQFRIRGKYAARATPEKLVRWCDLLATYINRGLGRSNEKSA